VTEYLSTAETKDFNLTPEEQAKLAQCVNPDAGVGGDIKFDYTPEMQNQILNILWRHPDCLAQAANVLKPSYFPQELREKFCTLLFSYYKKYAGRPSKNWLVHQYRIGLPLSVEPKPKIIVFGAFLNTLEAAYEIELHERQSLLDLVQDFGRHQATRQYTLQLQCAATETKDPKRFDEIAKLRSGFQMPTLVMPPTLSSTWGDLVKTAADQADDWLLPNWSEFGSVTLFSSLPKLGKSTIIAELIASSMVGRDFYGLPLHQAPILLVDPENKEKTLVKRLTSAMGDDGEGKTGDWLFRLNAFPKPLTGDYLRKAIDDVKRATGESKVIVVLDTLRSCYAGAIENENDNSEMAKVIVPLKDLAAETNSCVILIHHNTKQADSYAGGTAILSSVDYWWNWQTERKNMTGTLTCWGRGDFTTPIALTFDPKTQRNRVRATADDDGGEVDGRLLAVPVVGSGVSQEHLGEVWGVSNMTAFRQLKKYVAEGLVEAIAPENRKAGKTLYRQTNQAEIAA